MQYAYGQTPLDRNAADKYDFEKIGGGATGAHRLSRVFTGLNK